jgi:hypothetical protein
MITAQSLSHIAVQQQLLAASGDLQEAMAREAFKGLTAAKVASLGGNGNAQAEALLGFLGKITTAATSSAETRNWLTLPQQIRVKRIALEPGPQQLKLTSLMPDGSVKVQTNNVNIQTGEMAVWKVRSFSSKSLGEVTQMVLK